MGLKHLNTASWLWLMGLVGLCGLHRIYLDKKVTGVLWLLTFGLFGLGQLHDMFTVRDMVLESNTKFQAKVKYTSLQAVGSVPIYFNYAPTFNQIKETEMVSCSYCNSTNPIGKDCTSCGAKTG